MEKNHIEIKKAYNSALRLLALRNYSEKALLKKLQQKEFDKVSCSLAISKLKEEGLYKEQNYTLSAIRTYLRKGYTLSFIKEFLANEGIKITVTEIEELIQEEMGLKTDNQEQIIKLLNKKYSSLSKLKNLGPEEKYKAQQKILRFLVSKGHRLTECKKGLEKFLNTEFSHECL